MIVGQARAAIRRMRGRPRLWIWVGLAVALGVGLGWVPLFGVLGFELATAAALFAATSGLDLGCALARELARMPAGGIERASYPGRTMLRSTVAAAGLASAVAAIPAVIAVVRGIWQPTCDWWFGIAAYLSMPIATAALAGALGHALGVVIGPRRFIAAAAAQLVLLAIALAAVWRFYSEPPVTSYNPVLGYFPGNLYDENIQLRWPLLWSRLEDLAWVSCAVALVGFRLDVPRHRIGWRIARPAGRRLAALGLAVAAALAAIGLHLQAGALGYAVDASDIAEVLDGRIETAHFIIHYARSEDIDADIELIARDHEFRYAQVVGQLGVEPAGKLRSYYFASRAQKARWFGAYAVEMAKPWRGEIYLDHRPFPHPSLRHEIAHAVAGAFGDPIFGVAARHGVFINPGLIEGLAVALDWPTAHDRPTPHEAVRAMSELGLQPSIRQLLSLSFVSVSSARGYTTAGSFLKFLLDGRGSGKLRALYRSGGDFEAVYGASLFELESAWRQMIGKIELPAAAVEAQRERFRTASVFARPCPHAIAARRDSAFRAFGAGDRDTAIALLRRVCEDAPDEPRHRMELGDLLAAGGEPGPGRDEAAAIWTELADDRERVTSTLRVEALERLARRAAADGDRREVEALVGRAAALPLDSNERRQVDAEVYALGHQGPAAMPLYAYFFLATPLSNVMLARWAVVAEPELGFARYLLGLQHANAASWAAAADQLDRALALGLPSDQFARNAARRLALAGYRSRDRARVLQAIAVLSRPGMTAGDHLLARDWQDRLAFDERLALRAP